jgi:omega-6 fatty acid desaturase (delta-12 desaturase)
MNQMSGGLAPEKRVAPTLDMPARNWMRVLAAYRQPILSRSLFEIIVTLGPFILLWTLAWWSISVSYFLTGVLCVLAGAFLVRLFIVQHDCGHGAFFNNRTANDWVGRAIGVLTLTPYDVWRRSHSIHHSGAGNLEKRGLGDIHTMTVNEYYDGSWLQRLHYRMYRHPVTLFLIGPIYIFGLQNRLPIGAMKAGSKYWVSTMGTNLVGMAIATVLIYFMGLMPFLVVFLSTSFVASAIGVWLFYVQHQFDETHWDQPEDWDLHDAALYGSSHYDLPAPLRWITGNIGVHHVHHLYSRIPFYRLNEVIRDYPVLGDVRRLTLWQSFACARLHLWDEKARRLVSYRQARLNRA